MNQISLKDERIQEMLKIDGMKKMKKNKNRDLINIEKD